MCVTIVDYCRKCVHGRMRTCKMRACLFACVFLRVASCPSSSSKLADIGVQGCLIFFTEREQAARDQFEKETANSNP